MSIIREQIKKIIPAYLTELLTLINQRRAQAQKVMRIDEKNRAKIEELMRSASPIKLELGAGENRGIDGWTYADVNENCDLTLDLTRPFPFPDSSVQAIYSSHLLEHFEYCSLLGFLSECLRVLKQDGIFSAAIPNSRIYLDAYHNPENFDPDAFCRHLPAYHGNTRIDFVNYVAYMAGEHRYMFDEENIVAILGKAGFHNIRLRDFDETLDMAVRDSQSIYVIAEK